MALCHLLMVLPAPGTWPGSSVFVLVRTRGLGVLCEGVDCMCIVARDVIRQGIDSELLPSLLRSTLFFLREVRAEKNGTERTRPLAFGRC